MTSRDINILVKEGDKGVAKLFKMHEKYFGIVDEWSERLTNGDLLDEFEISQCMERLTGCMMKFGVVAGALEAIKEAIEQDTRVNGFAKAEKLNAPTVDVIKAEARVSINGIRKWSSDFRNYFYASQSGVTTAQSRLKRLTVTKGAKGVGYTGETPVPGNNDYVKPEHTTGDLIINQPETTCENNNEW